MQLYSTNQLKTEASSFWSLKDALLMGQAPERGLFMPYNFPTFSSDELEALRGQSFPSVALSMLQKLLADDTTFSNEVLKNTIDDALSFELPLKKVADNRYILYLDQGPTAAFKDVAARLMARWVRALLPDNERLVVLVATSGDTGSAVAHAYHGIEDIDVVVLFPEDEVSLQQRALMTTLGDNVTAIAVEGTFDNCQALVKSAFADKELTDILPLTSANSINIGRLLPQMLYYGYLWANLPETGKKLVVTVPSGNFGNLTAGLFARAMGIPIHQFVAAVNENDSVPQFLANKTFAPIVPSKNCISNAMNVGHPSNIARIASLFDGIVLADGSLQKQPDFKALEDAVYAVKISDEETKATMLAVYQDLDVILEPHGAVGWAGCNAYPDQDVTFVTLETAHPAKFPETVQSVLGITPEVPTALQAVLGKEEVFETIPADYQTFRSLITSKLRINN